ncbi:glycosyltransferase family 2 protein [Streptomyces coeruleorubidus]|uniref:glycosyltransferase family 2 protein n=1 Tax=Streptomyces coeruleorubidus TaxID=116188 RepID=UPI00366581D9
MPPADPPRVSVIIPAYNSMPELTRCVTSAMEQTLGLDKIEIIAVDDGSTDGTGPELDRLARTCPALRVVHQPNSGGAGAPRNTGLDIARGDYVFFLDSDDYLGPDALRRMVAMADENGTDVVLGKMVSVGGRAVPMAVFQHNQPRTDVFSSHAYRTLGCWKLFRRSLIERLHLRFPPYRNCEDKPFTAAAYLNADGVSVVADYDCYYVRNRESGNNLTRTAADLTHRMDGTRLCFETVTRYVEPGPRRDRVMRRHVEWELCGPLRALLPRESEQEARERFYPEFRRWALSYVTEGVFQLIPPPDRLLIHLLRTDRYDDLMTVARHAKEDAGRGYLVDKGRVYWCHPFFRDPARAVPDDCFDATDRLPVHTELTEAAWQGDGGVLRLSGHAYIEHVATEDPGTQLILRPRDFPHPGLRRPVTVRTVKGLPGERSYDKAGFSVAVDLATVAGGDPLDPGAWEFFLDVRAQGVSRTVKLRQSSGDAHGARTTPAHRAVAGRSRYRHPVVRPFFSPDGTLSLDVRPDPNQFTQTCHVTRTVWDASARGNLIVRGCLTGQATRHRGAITLRAKDASGSVYEVPVHRTAEGDSTGFTARLPVRPLPPGRWTITLHANETKETAVVPHLDGLTGTHWFRPSRLGRPYYARPLPLGAEQTLVLRVAPVRLATALRRRLDPRKFAPSQWGRRD